MRGWFEFETGIKPSRREATLTCVPDVNMMLSECFEIVCKLSRQEAFRIYLVEEPDYILLTWHKLY